MFEVITLSPIDSLSIRYRVNLDGAEKNIKAIFPMFFYPELCILMPIDQIIIKYKSISRRLRQQNVEFLCD